MNIPPTAPISLGLDDDGDDREKTARLAQFDQDAAAARELAGILATHYLTLIEQKVPEKRAARWTGWYQDHLLEERSAENFAEMCKDDEENNPVD